MDNIKQQDGLLQNSNLPQEHATKNWQAPLITTLETGEIATGDTNPNESNNGLLS